MRVACCLVVLLFLPAAAAQPEQVHLGLPDGEAATTRSVSWWSLSLEPEPLQLVTPEGTSNLQAERTSGPTIGNVWEARLPPLTPGQNYTYGVGDRSFAFRTPPDDPRLPTRFVALGDMGTSPRAAATVDAIQDLQPDFVLHGGDIAYAEGDQAKWNDWFRLVEPVASELPWLTALGNHETYLVAAAPPAGPNTEVQHYLQRFALPAAELWYSFDWGVAHVIALDTFSEAAAPTPTQLDWLRSDLADHANATWTIAFLHEPLYSSNQHGSSLDVREAFASILEGGGVDLVIQAHDHGYERSLPMLGPMVSTSAGRESREGEGVVYVVTGGGGESLYADWQEPPPAWSAVRKSLYHVLSINATAEALEGRVVPTQGDAFEDWFRIVKQVPEETADPEPQDAEETPGLGALAALVAVGATLARWPRRP